MHALDIDAVTSTLARDWVLGSPGVCRMTLADDGRELSDIVFAVERAPSVDERAAAAIGCLAEAFRLGAVFLFWEDWVDEENTLGDLAVWFASEQAARPAPAVRM
jgi:hypothetical protein